MLQGSECWSCPGDQLQWNITTLGPHEVAVATVAEGAGKLVGICMYLSSNCRGCVFVCAHEGTCSLQIASEAMSGRQRAVREGGRSEVVDLSPSVENRSGL